MVDLGSTQRRARLKGFGCLISDRTGDRGFAKGGWPVGDAVEWTNARPAAWPSNSGMSGPKREVQTHLGGVPFRLFLLALLSFPLPTDCALILIAGKRRRSVSFGVIWPISMSLIGTPNL